MNILDSIVCSGGAARGGQTASGKDFKPEVVGVPCTGEPNVIYDNDVTV